MATSLTRYQPTTVASLPDLVNRLFNESFVAPSFFNRYVDGTFRSPLPASLCETPDAYVMYLSLPGLSAENLDIQVVGRELTVTGHYEVETPQNGTWIWQGIPQGDIRETFTLPAEIDGDQVTATYEHGIVRMTLPKAAHVRPRSIKVSATK